MVALGLGRATNLEVNLAKEILAPYFPRGEITF